MAINYASREARTRDTTPFVLTSGSVPLTITVAGGTLIPGPAVALPTRDLVNSLQVPVEITELNFLMGRLVAAVIPNLWELSLSVGAHMISTWVPVCALAMNRNTVQLEGLASNDTEAMTVRWILPRPLILKPTEGFSGMARISPNISPAIAGPVTFSMVARGRRLPAGTPVPNKREIPYASGWIFPTANLPAPDMTYQNNFQVPLNVTSINSSVTDLGTASVASAATINSPGGLANTVLRGLASGVQFNALFAQRQALEEAHVLEPGEAYQITFSAVGAARSFFAVDLVGWREE